MDYLAQPALSCKVWLSQRTSFGAGVESVGGCFNKQFLVDDWDICRTLSISPLKVTSNSDYEYNRSKYALCPCNCGILRFDVHVHVQKLGPPYSQGICSQLMAGNAQVDPTRPHHLVDSDASRETKMVKDFQRRGPT